MVRFGVAAVLAVVSTGAVLPRVYAAQPVPPTPQTSVTVPAQASPTQAAEGRSKDRPVPQRRPEPAAVESKEIEPAQVAECAWTGKRVVSLLTRDDAMSAGDFMPFYLRFGCPEAHVGKTFGCVVRNDETAPNDVLAERIEKCWANPDTRFPKLASEPKADAPAAAPVAPAKSQGPANN